MNLSSNVRIDIIRNRLYCTFAEKSTAQELADLSAAIQRRVPELEPGFDVVEDMSRCHLFQLAALPALRNIMHYLVNSGAREVIRVVDNKSTVFRQFTNLSVRLRSYKPIYVSSMAEADDVLNQAQRRAGLRFDLPNTWVTVHIETGAFNAKAADISANGCAIVTEAESLSVGTEVRLKLPMKNAKGVTLVFEIPARVVRRFAGGVAVNFSEFNGTTKDEFMNCLIRGLQQQDI